MLSLFSLQVLEISELEVLEFWVFSVLGILEWFLLGVSKMLEIPVHKCFKRNQWWLNLVTYIHKCIALYCIFGFHMKPIFKKIFIYYVQTTREKIFLKSFGPQK